MIALPLADLFFVYLAVFLAGVFGVWLTYEMGKRFRDNAALRGKTQCAICGLVYRMPHGRRTAPPAPCPRCGTPNEFNPPQTI